MSEILVVEVIGDDTELVVEVVKTEAIVVETEPASEIVIETGLKGDRGDVGPAGPGIAAGGGTGQVLVKKSPADYDTEWQSVAGVARSYTHYQNTPAATWTVVHNLGYKPGGIVVLDSAGDHWVVPPNYVDDNTLTLTFPGAFSGVAYIS